MLMSDEVNVMYDFLLATTSEPVFYARCGNVEYQTMGKEGLAVTMGAGLHGPWDLGNQ